MSTPVDITDASFDEFVKEHGTVVVDFWAPWCGPCRYLHPILDELAGELQGKVAFAKINVDENPEKPSEYSVSGIPTMWLFRDGKPLGSIVGAAPKDSLRATLVKHLVDAPDGSPEVA